MWATTHRTFFSVQLIISRGQIQKIRPIREDLDAAVSSQKIIQISGQSRITLLNKYPNSIKRSKFTMRIMLFVVLHFLHMYKKILINYNKQHNTHSELWPTILLNLDTYSVKLFAIDHLFGWFFENLQQHLHGLVWFFESDLYWRIAFKLWKNILGFNYYF
jgi:hypothetical protein